jgi:hypothetical protein
MEYFSAVERNKAADANMKKASQKEKMYYQEKLRESGQQLDESLDRYEQVRSFFQYSIFLC